MTTDDHDDRVPAAPTLPDAWFRALLEGQRRMLERQIVHRFGSVSRATLQRLAAGDQTALDRWARRILFCDTLEELFAEPRELTPSEAWAEAYLQAKHEAWMEASRDIVLRTIRHRFGAPTPEIEALVANADWWTLDQWTNRTFSAATLDEYLDGPGAPTATRGD